MLRKLIFQIFLFFSSHIPVTCAHCDKSNSKRCAKKTSFFPTPLLPPCYTHFQKYPSLSFVGIPRTFLSTHTNTFVNIRDFFPLSMYMCFCCGFFFWWEGSQKWDHTVLNFTLSALTNVFLAQYSKQTYSLEEPHATPSSLLIM